MKKFNMNDFVKVRLSNKGAEIKNMINSKTNKFFEDNEIKDIKKLKEDYIEGDIYEGQLWEIMSEFGECLIVGGEAPFIDNDIYFDDERLEDAEIKGGEQ